MTELSYLQAVVIGALQGVTELFPISSLGHSVLVPALVGGSWYHLVTESSTSDSAESPYLAFIVALHVATALALLVFFWQDWVRIIGAFLHTLRVRRITTSTERLAWLIVVATVPVGLTGLVLEHSFRVLFAKPLAAAVFLTINGLILLGGERLRRRSEQREATARSRQAASAAPTPTGISTSTGTSTPTDASAPAGAPMPKDAPTPTGGFARGDAAAPTGASVPAGASRSDLVAAHSRQLDTLAYREAAVIGLFQTLALLAGISRSGITMVAGLLRGLDHEDAAKFSFLLATPVILAAGVLKLPTLAGPAGAGIHGQVIAGVIAAGIAAYLSVRFLTRYFVTRTLTPFGIYCLVAGIACIIRFA